MAACKQCGADTTGIACEFCGAIQSPPKTLEDELLALQALARAAQHVAATTSEAKFKGNSRADITAQMADQRLVAFWGSAWVPSHPDAIVQVIQSALAGVQYDEKGFGMGVSRQLPHALLARAQAALDALEIAAPGDARVPQFQRKIHERRTEGIQAQTKARNSGLALWGAMLGLPLIVGVGMAIKFGSEAPKIDADAPIPQAMQGTWHRSDTGDSYTLRVTETSMSCSETLASRADPIDQGSIIHQRGQGGLKQDGTFEFRATDYKCQLALADANTLIVSDGCGYFMSRTWTK